jgi:putative membrane-bound dehydrogenase-like protein
MRNHVLPLLLLAILSTGSLWAGGDKAGEAQPPPRITLPPSPPLSPEDALKSFKIQPGFKIELVAAEPLIHDPIAIAFDPDGRIWVVEYRAYMPDVDGNNEENPICSIAFLEDTDGDGKMDKRTEFLDKQYLPRAIGFTRGGVLIAEQMPPKLFLCRDTNGDGKCDDKILIAADYGGPGNPEHTANGLMPGLDNWIYSADCNSRFRPIFENFPDAPPKVRPKNAPPLELFKRERTNNRGQWGITMDDFGRQYYNSNSDFLRVDLMPTQYLNRNPNYRGTSGVNFQAMKDQSCWTGRPNIGVNRGYQAKQLRDDNRLATCTATCGPSVYRGDNLPAECLFNLLIPAPSGNMV